MHKGIQIDTIFDKTQWYTRGSGGAAPDAACGTDHVGAVAVVPAFRQHKGRGEPGKSVLNEAERKKVVESEFDASQV